jgi:hypothetical protein
MQYQTVLLHVATAPKAVVGHGQVEDQAPEASCVLKILFRNGNLTWALAGWWRRLWAGSGCGGSGRAPGWCGWAVASLLRRCCGEAVCWRPAISLLAQSVVVGEVG